MEQLTTFLSEHAGEMILGFVCLGLLVLILRTQRRANQLNELLNSLIQDAEGGKLEDLLRSLFGRLDQMNFNINQLGELQQRMREQMRLSVQKTALIRFNPFEDAGGDQSFAIALLDEGDNGLVISSLHAREGTRVYAKPIVKGRSAYPLADEEKDVLKQAIQALHT